MTTKLSHEYVKSYFLNEGYELLTESYVNAHTNLAVKCPEGHIYNTPYSKFQSGRRCPMCSKIARVKKMSLSYGAVKQIVESFGYVMISEHYINSQTHITVRCNLGHQYDVKFSNFQSGSRCPVCAQESRRQKRFLKYEDVNAFIAESGYFLLSQSYEYAKSKLTFRCPKGHEFEMCYASFKAGRRCPKCALLNQGKDRRLSYIHVKEAIESMDGFILLSKEYKGYDKKLSIRCPSGHIFKKSYDKFKQGQRCPICSRSNAEETIFSYLKRMGVPFLDEYSFPDLLSDMGNPLRFDFAIFDSDRNLTLLVEADGQFHFKKFFEDQNFELIQYHDKIKNTYCQTNSIPLLRIPYTQFDNIDAILSAELTKHNLLPSLAS